MAEPLLFRWRKLVVTDDRLSAADRHVALTLALHMNMDGGSCHPSVRRLAAECARKPHTVIASIGALEKAGYLKVKRAPKRNERAWATDVNQYTAQLPQGASAPVVPWGTSQLPEGTHKLFKSSAGGTRSKRATTCSECETGGGLHAADCSKAAE
jgi:Helix-turn-helix domain